MGLIWSSPYRWQIIQVGLGLLILVTGFVFLLLSIGLQEDTWRIVGGICASFGSAMTIIGTCWCVWAIRRCKYTTGTLQIPDWEAETLTSEAI